MKNNKIGFTLAEIMLTLSIIGVLAALVTPSLYHNITNAKIPPKLFKFKAEFDNAAQLMIAAENSDSILGINDLSVLNDYADCDAGRRTDAFGRKLSNYMKISENTNIYPTGNRSGQLSSNVANNLRQYMTDDGMYFRFFIGRQEQVLDGFADIPSNQKVGQLYLDINGPKEPNRMSKDIFWFDISNDGTLRPVGAIGFKKSVNKNDEKIYYWKPVNGVNRHGCDDVAVTDPQTCAGSIFDNGKIIYE